jgi:hypothetical protein
MKRLLFIILGALPLVIASSCGRDDLKPVFNKMKEAGCRADVEGFFSHVNMTAIRNNFEKDTVEKIMGGAYEDKLSERAQELSGEEWEKMASRFVLAVMNQYNDEIKKGKKGKICRMQIVAADNNTLTVKMPGEPDIIWIFGKFGEQLKLVTVY